MKFKHYLCTRFNIIQAWYYNCAKDGRGTVIQTEEWLNIRFDLFERYCFPSVKNQTGDFVWLVLFNSETPSVYKKRIAKYEQEMPNFVSIYLEPYADDQKAVQDYIHADCDADFLLTTRMDNDDMLHADYIRYVQSSISPTDHLQIFNYKDGYQYDVERQTLYYMPYLHNHYFTVAELYTASIHTCLGIDHTDLSKYGDYKELVCEIGGGWIEVLHSHNVANHRQLLRPMWNYHARAFAVSLPLNKWSCIREYIRWYSSKIWAIISHKFDKHIIKRVKKLLKV